MRWFGIDGGGTKTSFAVYDDDLRRLGGVALGTCHLAQVGADGMRDVLSEGVRRCVAAGLLEGAWGCGAGLAGYGEDPAVRERIREVVAGVVGPRPLELTSDVAAAHAAALNLADGIVVVAGTGAIAYGRRGDRTARCGGWGHRIGDEGSAWWIGRRVLGAFSRQSDGRSPRGPLHRIVREELGLGRDYDLVAYARDVLGDDRGRVAGLARLASRAAREGDRDGAGILADAAREDAALVAALLRELWPETDGVAPRGGGAPARRASARAYPDAGGPVLVSYVGGTFRSREAILGPLERALPLRCALVAPEHEPELGAVLLLRERLREEERGTS